MSTTADQKLVLDSEAVKNFVEYLQIPSVQPDINYDACIKFLEKQAKNLGLPIKVYYCVPNKPVVVITWQGKEPKLPSIILNSHMDVVPVFEDQWTHDPFGAKIIDGKIYARGTQDMKSVGIQYLEAVKRLKAKGVTLKRTLHLTFVPDEEIGGLEGMALFVKTKDFRNLNVGFSLDEGISSATDVFPVFYAERSIWQLRLHCPGQTGHGSLLLENTAGEKVNKLLNKIYEFRDQEVKKLKENTKLNIGDVLTLNVTQMKGGVQSNVVPVELIIVVDCRIPITVDFKKWEETLNQWCKEAGQGIWIEYEQKQPQVESTKLDNTNPYWVAFKEATDELGLTISPQVFPGGTDSRYIRDEGVPALGFSPINNTTVLLHNNDEYLGVNTFLKGIDIYCKILMKVGNVDERTG